MTRFEENPDWQTGLAEYKRELLAETITKVHDNADRLVPVATGHLKQRLYSYTESDGQSGVVGNDADYALWVEEGHRIAYRDSAGVLHYTGGVVPPQSFLRAALNSTKLE